MEKLEKIIKSNLAIIMILLIVVTIFQQYQIIKLNQKVNYNYDFFLDAAAYPQENLTTRKDLDTIWNDFYGLKPMIETTIDKVNK